MPYILLLPICSALYATTIGEKLLYTFFLYCRRDNDNKSNRNETIQNPVFFLIDKREITATIEFMLADARVWLWQCGSVWMRDGELLGCVK